MNLDLDQLTALAAIVEEGTFDGAAGKLNVTPSAISQRIKALETIVGRVLLTRSKPVRATDSGEALLRAARQIDAVISSVSEDLGNNNNDSPQVIALAVNADSLATWLVPALAAIGPPVVLELRRADETRTAEFLRNGTVMAAVTARAQPVPGCTVEPLGKMRYRPRATADYITRWFPEGATPHELSRAPLVCFDRDDDLQNSYLRRRTRRRLNPPRHLIPEPGAFVQAVRGGIGWAMVPDLQADQNSGHEPLIEFDPGGATDVRLFWQQWRLQTLTLTRVASAVREHAANTLG